jgi:microcystin-dependent protein
MKYILTLVALMSTIVFAQQINNKITVKELDVTGYINVANTTKGSIPCPKMTTAQINAIVAPIAGQCAFDTSLSIAKFYSGSTWNVSGTTDHLALSNIGTNTHAQIDSHVSSTANPHAVTQAQVGLANVDNTSDLTKNSAVATLTNKTLTSPVINTPSGLVKGDVGLSNVDNTSDATKNSAAATLTNKTLTSPVISTPSGLVKGDVGLNNVDNTSDATKNSAAVTLTNKIIQQIRTAEEIDSSTTGASQTLTSGSSLLRLTNASLTSVEGITAGAINKQLVIINSTGASIDFLNNTGTAANRIITGTGASLSLASDASLILEYSASTTKWQVIGGTGGGAPVNLTGDVTSVGAVTTLTNAPVIAKVLTGFASGAGTVTASDSLLTATQKLDGNTALKLGNTKSFADVSPVVTTQLDVPNAQLTTTATGVRRLETGNANVLSDPSFETASLTDWTCSLGTKTSDATNKTDGSKSLKIVSSGAGVRCQQVSTTNAASIKGQQMVARLAVNTTDTTGIVCAMVDGADTSDCVTIFPTSANAPFVQVEIPFIAGGVSNGISYKSATTTVQPTFLDESVVGKSSPFQNVNGARLMGTVTVTGCAAVWRVFNSTSYTDFGTQTGCSYATTGQALAPSTNLPAFKFASLPAGDYRIEYEGNIGTANSNNLAGFQFSDGTNVAREQSQFNAGTTDFWIPGISQTMSYSSPQTNVQFTLKAKGAASTNMDVYGTTARPGVFKLYYFPPDNKIYSQNNTGNAEDAGAVFGYAGANCPAGSLSADGSAVSRVTYSDLYRAIGITHGQGDGSTTFNIPDYRGRFLRGVSGASTNDPDKASRTAMATGGNTGNAVGSVQGDAVQAHSHGVNVWFGENGTGPKQPNIQGYGDSGPYAVGSTTAMNSGTSSSETRGKNAYVNYCVRAYNKNIVGSFAGTPKVPGYVGAVDTFSFSYGTTNATTACTANPCSFVRQTGTVVSSIGRTSTGFYPVGLSRTYSQLNCSGNSKNGADPRSFMAPVSCASCSTVNILTTTTDQSPQDSYGTVLCQGSY